MEQANHENVFLGIIEIVDRHNLFAVRMQVSGLIDH